MFRLIVILTTIFIALRFTKIMNVEDSALVEAKVGISNGASWNSGEYWTSVTHQYGIPFLQFWIGLFYGIYSRFTFVNTVCFFVKYVPTGIYVYTLMRKFYATLRERIKQKEIELEDIQLQIQIVNTKLSVRDAEFTERAEQLRRGAERLRRVRARVRNVIATDEALQRAVEGAGTWDNEHEINLHSTPQEDREFIVELLKELKCDQVAIPDCLTQKMESGEHAQTEPSTPESSIYSSLSDVDLRQDCRVKIVKVTNMYKVAYLKHYIKQKRLRRANKQAILKKKMENIKKLLEDWQHTLNMVINSKLTILNIDAHPMDVESQEARGDYSKPRESSDSDSDFRNSSSDMCYDEYSLSWAQNPYRPYSYSYEDIPETAVSRDYDPQDYGDTKYTAHNLIQCDYSGTKTQNMLSIIEETSSEMAIEEVKSEAGEFSECRDLVAI